MYYLTTTIDELGMADLINDTVIRINAPMKKRKPFGIVRTEEPIDVETMPTVMVSTFFLVLTDDVSIKNEKQAADFVAAMFAAVDEVRQMNEANYILIRPPRRATPGH